MIPSVLIAIVTLAPPTAPHPLEGSWRITYPWHVEIENGVPKPTMESGRMTVTAIGDSLVATIATAPSPILPNGRAVRLAALRGPGPVTFEESGQVTVSTPNGNRTMTDVITWTFEPAGDRLTGTLGRRIVGMASDTKPLPLDGIRVR